jgi:hypothetical protein
VDEQRHLSGGNVKLWKLFPVVLLIGGCGLATSSIASQTGTQTGAPPVGASQSPIPLKISNGPFTLTILSPVDQAEVAEPQVEIRGEVSSDSVVTINETTNIIDAGTFSQTVPLEEGLNTIQIVASDMDGNEVDLILTITFQP